MLYELTFVENYGSERKIWGFGVENIMEPPEPVDLGPVRHLFPQQGVSVEFKYILNVLIVVLL